METFPCSKSLDELICDIEHMIADYLRCQGIDPALANTGAMVVSTEVRNASIRNEFNRRVNLGENPRDIRFDIWMEYPHLSLRTIKAITRNER